MQANKNEVDRAELGIQLALLQFAANLRLNPGAALTNSDYLESKRLESSLIMGGGIGAAGAAMAAPLFSEHGPRPITTP